MLLSQREDHFIELLRDFLFVTVLLVRLPMLGRKVYFEVARVVLEGEDQGLVQLTNVQLDRLANEAPQGVLAQFVRMNHVSAQETCL